MVALTYESLGGISGVSENPKVPGSVRSRDRNNIQRFSFAGDPLKPFTGTIHLQASVSNPSDKPEDALWFDIAEMIIVNEGGTWSFEPVGEFASFRVVCKAGNYWSAAYGTPAASVTATGDFTINGITVAAVIGDNASAVAVAINSNAGIITDGTIVADVINSTTLRIYKTDGATIVLADTTNTPLADMGIAVGDVKAGVISKIHMLR